LTQPSLHPIGFKTVVIDAEDNPLVKKSISLSLRICDETSKPWVHIVRELKLYGLAMSAFDGCTEDEYENIRQGLIRDEIEKVENLIQKIPHGNVKINIKVTSGKSGFELAQFAQRKQADLLVVGAPERKFYLFDRVFTHDQEYIFADMPCNLLIVHPGKEEAGE
jgi:nucleotide-binding universal stress UspA family protein